MTAPTIEELRTALHAARNAHQSAIAELYFERLTRGVVEQQLARALEQAQAAHAETRLKLAESDAQNHALVLELADQACEYADLVTRNLERDQREILANFDRACRTIVGFDFSDANASPESEVSAFPADEDLP